MEIVLFDQGADGVQHVTVRKGGGVGDLFCHFVHGYFAAGLRLGVIFLRGAVIARLGAHQSERIVYTHCF
nr:MAG TPA: hypothetical protein [Caudoviricetes sp.]